QLSPVQLERCITKFDLTLSMRETAAGLIGAFEYNCDLFKVDTIHRLVGHFQTLLREIVDGPNTSITTLPILTETEQHQLLVEWNSTQTDYPQDKCIHHLFEEQVERTPEAIAIVFEDQQLTYQELNVRANQLALHLQTLGVKPGSLVGIGLNRSLEMVIGLLATLKTGAAYVPLDVNFPSDRLAFMVEDSDLSVLITTHEAASHFTSVKSSLENVCYLDTDFATFNPNQVDNLPSVSTANDLAYVIYTSGSTGKPKGVEICHGSVINFLQTMAKQPGLTAQDVLLSVTTLSFDIAVLELLLPLSVGARVIVVSSDVASDGTRLQAILKQSGITMMQATPATWQMLLASGWDGTPGLKMLCGGEPLPQSLAHKLLERGGSLWNLYGPTEATVWATVSQIKKDASITIGTPIDNTQVYLLNEQLNPVPVGVPGELHIGGAGLARGYLNRPELTNQRFIPNPFDQGKTRLYKTGDLARYLANGTIECLGRLDHQVKIRGFRMELGEIEAALTQHPDIKQTIVIAKEDPAGDKHLVAYSVTTSAEIALTPQEQRKFLQQKLPYYMVPSIFMVLDTFPLTPNGKINRRALPAPNFSQRSLENEFVAPSTPIEEQLCQIWCSVLRQDRIGIHDNFFDLGGHSLLAVQAATAITQIVGQPCAVIDFFQSPTIQQLAERLQNHQTERPLHPCVFPIQTISTSGYPLFCIHVLGRNLSFYRPLAKCMKQHTLYGLASELSGEPNAPHPQDIRGLATYYVKAIKMIQPEGPYHLIGISFGGFIAYEIAQRLVAQGDEIRLMGLLDTYSPIKSRKYLMQRLARHYQNVRNKGIDYVLLRLSSLVSGKRQLDLDEANEQAYADIKPEEYEEINKDHRFVSYPGEITLFRAQDDPDAKLGWKDIAEGGLVIHDIPGDHIGMLTEPNVQVLATHLNEILNADVSD
ncbi:MAG: amino acid adenylation domain-containing protein, partial [Leptolyngbya sp. SIO3F4]|nr:amino acid adenylation domain-containing protein [Leptolyngbya sp. SIO3F4]